MNYYFVAQIKINDPEEYQKYLDGCDEVFARYNGKYLAVDGSPTVLEGKWEYSRSVIIQFNCEADFRAWYESPEYQDILQFRLKSAQSDTILLRGLE